MWQEARHTPSPWAAAAIIGYAYFAKGVNFLPMAAFNFIEGI
jgi:hypothetical protein